LSSEAQAARSLGGAQRTDSLIVTGNCRCNLMVGGIRLERMTFCL
jgi:hypothetical protein